VLDDVQRRRFLVEPAGESAVPAPIGLLHVELDERAGQLLVLPWSSRLAGAQPDDDVLPPHRLAGMKRDVLDDPVSLVEDSKHRDPLRHRRHSALTIGGRPDLLARRQWRIRLLGALAASGQREHDQQRCNKGTHLYSGIQGS
jgi:hypothetical protein